MEEKSKYKSCKNLYQDKYILENVTNLQRQHHKFFFKGFLYGKFIKIRKKNRDVIK